MAFCKKLRPKIQAIIKKVDAVVNKYSDSALEITSTLKTILGGPVGQIITGIIPGTWDDELRQKAVKALDIIVNNLSMAKDIAAEPDLNKKVQLFLKEIADQHPEYQEAMLFKIASLLTKYMHGELLSNSEYDLITQAKYISKK